MTFLLAHPCGGVPSPMCARRRLEKTTGRLCSRSVSFSYMFGTYGKHQKKRTGETTLWQSLDSMPSFMPPLRAQDSRPDDHVSCHNSKGRCHTTAVVILVGPSRGHLRVMTCSFSGAHMAEPGSYGQQPVQSLLLTEERVGGVRGNISCSSSIHFDRSPSTKAHAPRHQMGT